LQHLQVSVKPQDGPVEVTQRSSDLPAARFGAHSRLELDEMARA